MARRAVDCRRVRAAVPGAAAAVAVDRRVEAGVETKAGVRRLELDAHQHRVPARVGDVLRLNLVLAALRRRRDRTCHAACLGQRVDAVRRVARLEVGERLAVGDDVLERLEVRVVDRRVVDVAQDAVRDRVPHLRRRVARSAETVFPCKVEVRKRAGIRADGQDVRDGIPAERDLRVVCRDRERNVRPARRAARAVVHVPALVERHLRLVVAGRERRRLERVGPVAVGILELRAQAVRLPVPGTAELGLEAPCDHGDQ